MSKRGLTETLQTIEREAQGDRISFGDLVKALNQRGFGPMLMAPALIGVLPTGAIPFMPDLVALFIVLIAVQLLMGRDHPWMPQRLKEYSFKRKTYKKGMKLAKPYTKWIDSFFHPRFQFLTGPIAQKFIAVLCIVLAFAIAILAFIPFAAAAPCAAVLFFALGLTVHDGLLTAVGMLFMTLSLGALPFLWSSLPF